MTSQSTSSVLLAGATSPIGQRLARLLLQRGHPLRVLTRAPSMPALVELARLGAELIEPPDEPEAQQALCREADSVVLAPALLFEPAAELGSLDTLIDAAGAAAARGGPQRLVLVSAASADESTGVPYLEQCHRLEQRAAASGLPFAVIRPVLLAESLLTQPFLGPLADGRLELPLSPWRRLQWVSALDVAEATARVLEEPERFLWRILDVAGDSKSPAALAALLAEALGRSIEITPPPPERLLALDPELLALFAWLEEKGTRVDIDAVRVTFPALPVGALETWAATIDTELLEIARSRTADG